VKCARDGALAIPTRRCPRHLRVRRLYRSAQRRKWHRSNTVVRGRRRPRRRRHRPLDGRPACPRCRRRRHHRAHHPHSIAHRPRRRIRRHRRRPRPGKPRCCSGTRSQLPCRFRRRSNRRWCRSCLGSRHWLGPHKLRRWPLHRRSHCRPRWRLCRCGSGACHSKVDQCHRKRCK